MGGGGWVWIYLGGGVGWVQVWWRTTAETVLEYHDAPCSFVDAWWAIGLGWARKSVEYRVA